MTGASIYPMQGPCMKGWPSSEKTGTSEAIFQRNAVCAFLEEPVRASYGDGYEQQLARTGPWCFQSRNLSKDITGQVQYHTESCIPAITGTAWCDEKIN